MNKYCILRPDNIEGENPKLFDDIKKVLSIFTTKTEDSNAEIYNTAWDLYGLAQSPDFREMYDTLEYDNQGYPTLNSLLNNEMAETLINPNTYNNILESNFSERPYNLTNYNDLVKAAYEFNKTSNRKIAFVSQKDDGTLKIKIVKRNKSNLTKFAEQYSSMIIASKISNILSPIGITVGDIIGEESRYRNGKVDFNKAKDAAEGTKSFVMVANNINGAKALSEEFSHVIIGAKREEPLIKRLLSNLSSNKQLLKVILGDKYDSVFEAQNGNINNIAEEALGQLLHLYMIENKSEEILGNKDGSKKLFDRFRNSILSKFKGVELQTINDIINTAENIVSTISEEVTTGRLQISNEDIIKSQKDLVMNDLVQQSEAVTKALEYLINTEKKRETMLSKKASKKLEETSDIIDLIEGAKKLEDPEAIFAMSKYANYAIKILRARMRKLSEENMSKLTTQQKCATIRNTRSYLISFKNVIKEFYKLAGSEELSKNPDNFMYMKFQYTNTSGETKESDLRSVMKQLNTDMERLEGLYENRQDEVLLEFAKPFLDGVMTEAEIKEMFKGEIGDISAKDLYLDAMADSKNTLLRTLETIRKAKLGEARLKSIDYIKEITALMVKSERDGLTDFEWMFEKFDNGDKTGYYIQEYNMGKYNRDLKAEKQRLKDLYGDNPSKENKAKIESALDKWHLGHSKMDPLGHPAGPNALYLNKDFNKLSRQQREFLTHFYDIKDRLEKCFPPSKLSGAAIQIRKDGVQRFIDLSKNPTQIFDNIKEGWKTLFGEAEDDDLLYGSKESKTLTGFDGREFNILPIMYNNMIADPNELSTDVFRSLIAYAVSSCQYEAIDSVIDGLESIHDAVADDKIKIQDTEGDNPLVENLHGLKSKVFKKNTIVESKLEEWYKTLYGEKYSPGTNFTHNGKVIANSTKATSVLTGMASSTQLAFNYLANAANVLTGVAALNIEAHGGQFFNKKELLDADKEYAKMIPDFAKELGSRVKTSKMSLFCELFNVKYNFDKAGKEMKTPSILKRILGEEWAYMGQDGGDHWLYTRVAIAMAKHEKVTLKNGETKSLWDILEVKDSEFGEGLKKMVLPDGCKDSKGRPFSISRFSNKVGYVCRSNFGNYNEWDRTVAQKYCLGRLLMMYRQWIVPQFNNRFGGEYYNQDAEAMVCGYYRKLYHLISDAEKRKILFSLNWDKLSDEEKSAARKCLWELGQTLTVFLIAEFLFGGGRDKDRPWLKKFLEYMAKRELHELGNLTPSLIMTQELSKTIKSPMAVLTPLDNIQNCIGCMIDPRCWNNEIASGPYKGRSDLYKALTKLPIGPLQWYNQIDKTVNSLDDKISYYN